MNISIKLPDNVVDYLLKTLLFLNEEEKASD
jgi:hypothetical protein